MDGAPPRRAGGPGARRCFLIAGAATVAFLLLAAATRAGLTAEVDARILGWFLARRAAWLDRAMLGITALGSALTLLVLAAALCSYMWLHRRRRDAGLLAAAVVGAILVNQALKLVFGVPRPGGLDLLPDPLSPAFPSGHAMQATAAYGMLAVLLTRARSSARAGAWKVPREGGSGGSRGARPSRALGTGAWTAAVLFILLISCSRLYLNVHHPSDVVAGILAGVAWLGVVLGVGRTRG